MIDWNYVANDAGRRLALCANLKGMQRELVDIEVSLRGLGAVPGDFWENVLQAYNNAPKPLYEESAAAAALNALVASAQQLLRARAKK
jgi:hypothetical protein